MYTLYNLIQNTTKYNFIMNGYNNKDINLKMVKMVTRK